MHAEVPRARAAHREAGVHEAAAVHGIRARRGVERLEDVHLAGEFRGVAVAAVGVDDDVRVGREFACGFHASGDEGEFAERVAAAVIPDPRRARSLVGGAIPCRGDDDAEGLHAAVNLRAIAAHDRSGLRRPRSLALAQRGDSRLALGEQRARGGDFLHVVEFVVAQRPVHGLVEDFHVGKQRAQLGLEIRGFQRGDFFAKLRRARGEFRAILFGNLDALRRELLLRAILRGRRSGRVGVRVGGGGFRLCERGDGQSEEAGEGKFHGLGIRVDDGTQVRARALQQSNGWMIGDESRTVDSKRRSRLPGGARDSRAVCGDPPQTPAASVFVNNVQIDTRTNLEVLRACSCASP